LFFPGGGELMRVSVVVRSRDEAERLRLTLTSLARQTVAAEVILVNDGSLDRTPEVIAEAADSLPLNVVAHATPRGRSGAANAGARVANGDVLLFLDGDTVANRDLVARHLAVHSGDDALVGRGETFHLRGTRFLRDPELGIPWPGEETRLGRLSPGELSRLRVTRDEIINRFEAFDRRAEAGIYPGTAPRRLYELEMDALIHHPGCTVLWAAACGSNLSVRKDQFLHVGGFDEGLDMNEHRELAFRLCLAGARMIAVPGARTYHLTHRVGWRDPLSDTAWEKAFYRAHPVPVVKLLSVFWASMCGPSRIPGEAQIKSLPELEAAARGHTDVDYDAVRRFILALPMLDSGLTSAKFAHSEQQDRL
jgi:glycosyltransferase involved in cell wall biosynthesis